MKWKIIGWTEKYLWREKLKWIWMQERKCRTNNFQVRDPGSPPHGNGRLPFEGRQRHDWETSKETQFKVNSTCTRSQIYEGRIWWYLIYWSSTDFEIPCCLIISIIVLFSLYLCECVSFFLPLNLILSAGNCTLCRLASRGPTSSGSPSPAHAQL